MIGPGSDKNSKKSSVICTNNFGAALEHKSRGAASTSPRGKSFLNKKEKSSSLFFDRGDKFSSLSSEERSSSSFSNKKKFAELHG